MFTGIVEELGTVVSRDGERLAVRGSVTSADAAIGDSLAIDGVCLTVVELEGEQLSFDLSEETLARSTLGSLGPGDAVNLERPATLASRLGGHLVQGHVDGVAEVTTVRPEGEDGVRLSARLPGELLRHVVEKGSITLDGVSLTVAALDGEEIEIALIPHTLDATTLGSVREGGRVNVEVDIVAKYVARYLEHLTTEGATEGATDGATVVRPRKERTA